jgi:hypothetical protein
MVLRRRILLDKNVARPSGSRYLADVIPQIRKSENPQTYRIPRLLGTPLGRKTEFR